MRQRRQGRQPDKERKKERCDIKNYFLMEMFCFCGLHLFCSLFDFGQNHNPQIDAMEQFYYDDE